MNKKALELRNMFLENKIKELSHHNSRLAEALRRKKED